MMTLQNKPVKASLLKLFALDPQGMYMGEYSVDDECPVDFNEFIKAVGNMAMGDRQTVHMGELSATMLQGARLNLIAISRGPLGSQELDWAKATMTTVETLLVADKAEQQVKEEPPAEPEVKQDPGLDTAMSKLREEEIRIGEAASKLEEDRKRLEHDMNSLMEREAELLALNGKMEERLRRSATSAQNEEQLRAELSAKEERVRDLESSAISTKEKEEQMRKEFETMRSELDSAKEKASSFDQLRAELSAKEEKARELESSINASREKEEQMRKEFETLRAELDSAKGKASSFDLETAKKEIEMRVKILQKKALELLEREERLRKKEEELSQVVGA